MIETPTVRQQCATYVAAIGHVCANSTGTRATLRRGLRRDPLDAPRLHALIQPRLPPGISPSMELPWYAAATWVAMYGTGHPGVGMGKALRGIKTETWATEIDRLPRSPLDVLCLQRLPRMLHRLSTAAKPVPDLGLLLHDLVRWGYGHDADVYASWLREHHAPARSTS